MVVDIAMRTQLGGSWGSEVIGRRTGQRHRSGAELPVLRIPHSPGNDKSCQAAKQQVVVGLLEQKKPPTAVPDAIAFLLSSDNVWHLLADQPIPTTTLGNSRGGAILHGCGYSRHLLDPDWAGPLPQLEPVGDIQKVTDRIDHIHQG